MIYINAVGMINALGDDTDTIRRNLPQHTAPNEIPKAGYNQVTPAYWAVQMPNCRKSRTFAGT